MFLLVDFKCEPIWTQKNDANCIEFHADDSAFATEEGMKVDYGGSACVRAPVESKRLIFFGQDECVFKQCVFRTQTWIANDGTCALIPKDEGNGVTTSAFFSR